jgi:D-3-phosphoglycerate dehydrogenase
VNGNNTRDVMRWLHRKKPLLQIHETEHFSESVMRRLKQHFLVMVPSDPEYYCRPSEVLWVRLKWWDSEFKIFPNLKLIACNCTDVSHLPLEECQRRGIEVLSLKGIEGLDNVYATAEHTISLMLQALRHRCTRSSGRIGRELNGKKVCIVGHGRIGRQVSAVLMEMGCTVWGFRDGLHEAPRVTTALIANADIISIHASLNETSRGMVNAEFLSKLKPGAVVVNTARHAIVDENAIFDWLLRDGEAIYAHDFADEWNPPHCRVIGTKHIGGWTIESLHKTEELLAEKVIQWSKSEAKQMSNTAATAG